MFHGLANLADLYDGYCEPYRIQGESLLLIQEQGQQYLIENRCPHMDAPLATGQVLGDSIRCRAHGIVFSLQTGHALGPLAETLDCLKFYPVVYDGSRIGVDL